MAFNYMAQQSGKSHSKTSRSSRFIEGITPGPQNLGILDLFPVILVICWHPYHSIPAISNSASETHQLWMAQTLQAPGAGHVASCGKWWLEMGSAEEFPPCSTDPFVLPHGSSARMTNPLQTIPQAMVLPESEVLKRNSGGDQADLVQ